MQKPKQWRGQCPKHLVVHHFSTLTWIRPCLWSALSFAHFITSHPIWPYLTHRNTSISLGVTYHHQQPPLFFSQRFLPFEALPFALALPLPPAVPPQEGQASNWRPPEVIGRCWARIYLVVLLHGRVEAEHVKHYNYKYISISMHTQDTEVDQFLAIYKMYTDHLQIKGFPNFTWMGEGPR